MTLFQSDRALLYPQFETYRLHSLSPDDDVAAYPLPGPGATQTRLEHAHHNLSFKETRSRVGWDHLTVDEFGRGVYVDKDYAVWGFVLDEALRPIYTKLVDLPTPISSASSSSTSPAPEYPSVKALSPTLWVVSTGTGMVYTLESSSPGQAFSARIQGEYDLKHAYLLHAARLDEDGPRLVVSRAKMEERKHVGFELVEVQLHSHGSTWTEVWRLEGGDAPVWCAWDGQAWMVLCGETMSVEMDRTDETQRALNTKEKEEQDVDMDMSTDLAPTPDAHPYTWKQTGESATIRIPFSPQTQRSDFNITLGQAALSLSSSASTTQPGALTRFMRFTEHTWWAPIDPSESSFTFDPSKGVLEIDITKVDSPNRWPSLFLPDDSEDGDAEFDVPETIDAGMMAAVRATFDSIKTRELQSPSGVATPEPMGNHPAIPSLFRDDMDFDDEEDFDGSGALGEAGGKVGRDVFIGRIENGKAQWSKTSTSVLSVPLTDQAQDGLIIKSAVDGLMFTPTPNSTGRSVFNKEAWAHKSTVPALAFVLSSKRDIRLIRHLHEHESSTTTVLAFDSGGAGAGQGNVYVYYPPSSRTTAGQGVVRVSGGERGALLGLGICARGEMRVVVALCEHVLVVLQGVV